MEHGWLTLSNLKLWIESGFLDHNKKLLFFVVSNWGPVELWTISSNNFWKKNHILHRLILYIVPLILPSFSIVWLPTIFIEALTSIFVCRWYPTRLCFPLFMSHGNVFYNYVLYIIICARIDNLTFVLSNIGYLAMLAIVRSMPARNYLHGRVAHRSGGQKPSSYWLPDTTSQYVFTFFFNICIVNISEVSSIEWTTPELHTSANPTLVKSGGRRILFDFAMQQV